MDFTAEAVLTLAPDDASAKAARGLVSPAKWPTLGADERAAWGECQGSGSKPYQTQVDLSGPTFKCSCPSRKFPCKHGLALLLLRAAEPQRFGAAAPAWVEEWLGARKERAEKKEQRAAERAAAPPPSPEELEKREAQRWRKVEDGFSQLQRWMADQVDRGLANLGGDARGAFETMAARLVDAQAPGAAQRLRELAELVGQGADWPARLLHGFGRLQLLADGVAHRAGLEASVLADLRATLGWGLDKEDVLVVGEHVTDQWQVLGTAIEQRDARLQERRVWLRGTQTGREALLLDFSFAAGGFGSSWVVGRLHAAELAFHPGAAPLRAVAVRQDGVDAGPVPAVVGDGWEAAARRWSRNPWPRHQPLLLAAAALQRGDGPWRLRVDDVTLPLRLADESGWSFAAVTGGRPATVFGEWDGEQLAPLTAWTDDGLWTCGSIES